METPWAQVAGTYDLDFGKAVLPKKSRFRRGFMGDIWDAVEDVVHGEFNEPFDAAFDISAGDPGNRFNILPGGRS